MQKKQPTSTLEIFPENICYQSIGVGMILLSNDFKIFYKNPCSKSYLKLPKKGADLVKILFDRESRKNARLLSQSRDGACFVRFTDSNSSVGLMISLPDGNFAVILHSSISVVELLCARYSSQAMQMTANCVVKLYQGKNCNRYIISGKNPFKMNVGYLAEKHTVMRLLSLSDGISLVKSALLELCLNFPTEISISESVMMPYKFIDTALLAYAASELLATARIYSQGSAVKLVIDTFGCTARVRVTGKIKISSRMNGKIFEKGSTNLRLMLVAAALAAVGVDFLPIFKNGRFELTTVIPLAEKNFETMRLSTVLAKQFFVSRIVKLVFFAKENEDK